VPLKVDQIAAQVDAAGARSRRRPRRAPVATELALFTRQLASLLEAGLPLEQAFTGCWNRPSAVPARPDRLGALRSHRRRALSVALARHPRDFAEIYRALVASGEQIGQLSRVLSRLADYIERAMRWCRRCGWRSPIRPSSRWWRLPS
jgi:general secretion pathway protein F